MRAWGYDASEEQNHRLRLLQREKRDRNIVESGLYTASQQASAGGPGCVKSPGPASSVEILIKN